MELRQYFAILWKWTWLIVLCILLAGGSAYVVSERQLPTYQATATLLVSQASSASTQDYSALLTGERLARTYAQMLTTRPVMEEVVRRLDLPLSASAVADKVSVTIVRDTQLITLRVVDEDPARARDIANTIPVVFGELNEQMQLTRYSSSKENLQKQLDAVNTDILSTQASLDSLRASASQDQAEINRLEAALLQYRTTYANLLRSYEDIRVAEAKTLDTVTIVEPAVLASSPVGPKTRQNTLLAGVVGAVVAIGVAFLIEYLDDTVKSPEDVERTTHLPTFGAIVNFPRSEASEGKPIMAVRPKSAIAEGYRVLRTNLQFSTMGVGKSGTVLLVTSAQPLEGKTTSLVNLGVSLAQAGKRVLLVDTDLRRPALHKQFNLSKEAGLTTLLLEQGADIEKVIRGTEVEGLRVLTAGHVPANPAEVLDFPETKALLERLRPTADYVLLDSPPVLSVADASILAQKVDGVLLVVETGRTRTDMFQRAVAALQGVKARVLGVVLNKVSVRRGGYYDYYYYYYYSGYYKDEEGRKRKKKGRPSLIGRVRRLGQAIGRPSSNGAPPPLLTEPASGEAVVQLKPEPLPKAVEIKSEVAVSKRKREAVHRRSGVRLWLVATLVVIAAAVAMVTLSYRGIIAIRIPLPTSGGEVQRYINQGHAFFIADDYEKAIESFNKALEIAPDNAEAKVGLEKAQEYLQVRALYAEAKAFIDQNRYDLALGKLEALIEMDPWYKDAGILLTRCQRYQELDRLYEEAVNYYNAGEWGRAASIFQAIPLKDAAYRQEDIKSKLFDCYLNDGKQRIANANSSVDIIRASQSFNNALSLFPDSTAAQEEKQLASFYGDGFIAYSESNWRQAIANLSKIYNLYPEYAAGRAARLLCESYVKLGDAHRAAGELQAALEQYRMVLTIPQCDQTEARAKEQEVLLQLGLK